MYYFIGIRCRDTLQGLNYWKTPLDIMKKTNNSRSGSSATVTNSMAAVDRAASMGIWRQNIIARFIVLKCQIVVLIVACILVLVVQNKRRVI